MATTQSVPFGDLLRRLRRAAGLTQEELAEQAGLSARVISDLERGLTHRPRKDTIQLLSQALQLSAEERTGFEAAGRMHASTPPVDAVQPHQLPAIRATSRLVGRVRELAALERHLAGQGPPLFLLAGEPGIGKSHLLWRAVEEARAGGYTVLAGGCHRRGGQEPYAPFPGVVRDHVRAHPADRLRLELQGCAWLVRLLPELADGPVPPPPDWKVGPEQEHRFMVEAALRFLSNVAGPAGTLVALDDLQWADPDALDLLATLVRSAPAAGLRFVGAYRETEVDPQAPLFGLLADLASAGLAARRSLAPLAPEEAAQLLDDLLEGTDAGANPRRDEVLLRTGGVPFFLVSCAQGWRLGEEQEDGVPWDLAQSIRQRVAALPSAAREVLGTAAVVGRAVPASLLMRLVARPEEEVLAAFDAACTARLLEEAGEEMYRFVHDVIREVTEADLGAARRRVLHRRVAEVLEVTPGGRQAELLAFHYARSDASEKAAPYLEQMGDRAQAQNAHASAAGYYQELVDRLDRLGRENEAGRACEKLGVALYLAAGYDRALPALERAVQTYEVVGDLEGQRRTLAQIGWLHATRGTLDEGIARIESELHTLDPETPSPGLARLYVALTQLYGVRGRTGEGWAAAERAAQIARATDDTRVLAAVEAARSDYLPLLERFDEGLRAAEGAVRLAEQVGDLAALCTAYRAMLGCYLNKGEGAKARVAADRAVEVAEQLGDPSVLCLTYSSRALATLDTGEWDLARVDLEKAVALGREIGPSDAAGFALMQYGRYCLYVGDWDEAARHLEGCVAMAARNHQLSWAQTFLAELDLRLGQPERARDRLVPFLDQPDPTEIRTLWMNAIRPVLARAYLELGELSRAEDLLATHLAWAQETGFPGRDVLRGQALLAARQGRWAEAHQAAEEGLHIARTLPIPYSEALLLEVCGQIHAHQGEPEQARERMQEALAIFRRLGARKDAERTEQALERLA